MSILVIVIFAAVMSRYVFFTPLNFANMLSKYLVMWLTFLGASIAIREGEHIAVNFFVNFLSNKKKKLILIVSNLIVSLFCITIIYYGILFSINGITSTDPLLFGMRMIYPYLSVPVGFSFILIQYNLFTIIQLFSNEIKSNEKKHMQEVV
ncbi:TRAP transporter small permease [Halanaerobium sp. Z-7514]|uniref:TRAP transporter small permease n=1 Tax=Halanaerobium polyolivorans TaxID=2886943 RepID=A0AAW4X1R5_9FIRM|nr:TRAP transporter small permease [Halanaerobium polyolivorans]